MAPLNTWRNARTAIVDGAVAGKTGECGARLVTAANVRLQAISNELEAIGAASAECRDRQEQKWSSQKFFSLNPIHFFKSPPTDARCDCAKLIASASVDV